jgi:uncharacterized protein YecA (UPF0149 family)
MAKAKTTKVTEQELKELQEVIKTINSIQMEIGNFEVQKTRALSAIMEGRAKLAEVQNKLKEKYGDVNVNINDGTITEQGDGKVDKKD